MAPVLAHPAVTTSGATADSISLRIVDLEGVKSPMYLIEAADRPSKRAIDALAAKLAPPAPRPVPPAAAAHFGLYASGFASLHDL